MNCGRNLLICSPAVRTESRYRMRRGYASSVYYFDEPTAMLDPKDAGRSWRSSGLSEDGITVILITHFMEEAVEADRIIA